MQDCFPRFGRRPASRAYGVVRQLFEAAVLSRDPTEGAVVRVALRPVEGYEYGCCQSPGTTDRACRTAIENWSVVDG
jgi:hypothetical protein